MTIVNFLASCFFSEFRPLISNKVVLLMLLSELFKGIDVVLPKDDINIIDIATKSSDVKEGSLFVALVGTKVDGHSYANQAFENGAVAILAQYDTKVLLPHIIVENTRIALSLIWSNFLKNPAKDIKLFGVTGTNGKTTVTYLTQYILSQAGFTTGLIGTIENLTGEGIQQSKYTTPEPSELQSLLLKMKNTKCTHIVMEVSSQAIAQDRVAGLTFEVGAFTNLSRDHLDYHLTMENYLNEKLKLMFLCKKAVINADDTYANDFMNRAKFHYSFGIEKPADFKAINIVHTAIGSKFTLLSPEGKFNAFIGIPGQFSVYNALCSIAIAYASGLPVVKATEILKFAKGVKGRMETVDYFKNFSVIIDYAHTPDGLLNALKTLKEIPKEGRLIVLFGCGGDRDKTKRPIMGNIACDYAGFVIVTSDNPRTEKPKAIIDDILKGMVDTKTKYEVIIDRRKAIYYAINNAKKGDIILLAGKGHETYQILNDKTIHFDEREVLHEAILQ